MLYKLKITDEHDIDVLIQPQMEWVELTGSRKSLTVPKHVVFMDAAGLGLEEIIVHDDIEFLYCPDNNLTSLVLPAHAHAVNARDNQIHTVTCSMDPTRLMSLDLCNNKIKDFTVRLPDLMDTVWFADNPDIADQSRGSRIKYQRFIIDNTDLCTFIDTDLFQESYYPEHIRSRFYALCRLGMTYIDIEKLHSDRHFLNCLIAHEPSEDHKDYMYYYDTITSFRRYPIYD